VSDERLRSNGLIESAASGLRGFMRIREGGASDKSERFLAIYGHWYR